MFEDIVGFVDIFTFCWQRLMEHIIFGVNPSAPNASLELVFNDPIYVEEMFHFLIDMINAD